MKRIAAILLIFITLLSCLNACTVDPTQRKYEKALKLLKKGKHEEAYEMLIALGDYKDSRAFAEKFYYVTAKTTETQVVHDRLGIRNEVDVKKFVYNRNGICAERICFFDGGGKTTCKLTYDDNGNLIKEKSVGVTDNIRIYEFVNNENGDVVKMDDYNSGKLYQSIKYSYDEARRIVKQVETYANNGRSHTYMHTYDENGSLIKTVTRDVTGSLYTETYDLTYDDKKRVIKKVYNYSIDSIETTEYTYNDEGYVVKIQFYNTNNYNETTEHTYDKNGNLSKTIIWKNDAKDEETRYIYNDNGYLERKEVKFSLGDEYVTYYYYDSNGNLIKEVLTRNDRLVHTTEKEYKLVYMPYDFSKLSFITNQTIVDLGIEYKKVSLPHGD